MSSAVAAAEAFTAQVDALREQHGAGTLVVKPSVYRLPDGSELAVGGWAFLDGEPAVIPAFLTVLVVTEGTPKNDKGVGLDAALGVLAPFSERRETPVDHHLVTVPEADKPAVMAALRALPSMNANPAHAARAAAAPDKAINDDIAAAESPMMVKLSAAVQGVAGVLVGLSGLQLAGARWTDDLLQYSPYLLMALGVSSLFMAANQFRARMWAGVGSMVLSSVMALTMLGWVIMMFSTVMSCMAYLAVPLTMVSVLLSLVAFPSVRATAAARQRLAEQGLSLGL